MSDTAAGGAGEAELRQAREPFVSRHPDWPEDNRIAVQILSAAITELVALRAVAGAARVYLTPDTGPLTEQQRKSPYGAFLQAVRDYDAARPPVAPDPPGA